MNKNDETKKNSIVAKTLANVAKGFCKVAANSACCYIYHQPKLPQDLKKLRKF